MMGDLIAANAAYLGMATAIAVLIALLVLRARMSRAREQRTDSVFAEGMRISDDIERAWHDEQARWHPVSRYGCHEYQQHEDGRRRAVRVAPGEDVLDKTWLVEGAEVML